MRPTARATSAEAERSPAERRRSLLASFEAVRSATCALAAPLAPEDMVVQSMSDASPAKWHLAHTTWFFDAFVLRDHEHNYAPHDERYGFLFNSYYNAMGQRMARHSRGMATRPTVDNVLRYRADTDERIDRLVTTCSAERLARIAPLVEIGVQHEQQHQELLLTDVKHLLSCNPLLPAYRDDLPADPAPETAPEWVEFDEGVRRIGHDPDAHPRAFAYDTAGPRHRVFLERFSIANRPVTNAEYAAFVDDGGYERPELWLDAGWTAVEHAGWRRPIYWAPRSDHRDRREFTLAGLRPLDPHAPVCHLSHYEADAYARWAGARLPTEFEWEAAAVETGAATRGNFADAGLLHPGGADGGSAPLHRLFGDVWEWTRSAYAAYPGFAPRPGAIGEYNGKFMCGQYVLRGGSCATPASHIRPTYRNFFVPDARWQFAGVRLAKDPQ